MDINPKDITISLCESVEEFDFTRKGHFYERKIDGERCVAIDGRLYNRKPASNQLNREITKQFPEIRAPRGWVFDGEIEGKDVGDVVGRTNLQDRFRIELRAKHQPCMLIAFDVLFRGEEDFRDLPQMDRKRVLNFQLPEATGVEVIESTIQGFSLWQEGVSKGWEGLVIKDMLARYYGCRTEAWLKLKNCQREALPILRPGVGDRGGFVIWIPAPAGEQKVAVNGFDDQREITRRLEAGEELKAKIRFLEITERGWYRNPSFKGLA